MHRLVCTFFAGLHAVALAATLAGTVSAQRPNLIVIVTDDQRFDQMGCAGHEFVQTPHMDALAQRGVRFVNAFVTTSICAASRASILTGLWEGTHGYTFGKPALAAADTDRAWPRLLRDNGYRTGFVGKWGVRTQEGVAKAMWDEFRPMTAPYLRKQQDGSVRHITDLVADRGIAFLQQHARGSAPFCLMLCYNAPHADDGNKDQYVPPPELASLYDGVVVDPPALGDRSFFDALPVFQRESMNRDRWFWRFDEPAKYQRMVHHYWAMITGVDRSIGRVLAEVAALGHGDDTVVLFTSDNGYFLGERGFAGKWTIHELSIRIPLVVADPRAKSQHGTTRGAMVLNTDLAPTVLDLAGVARPDGYQGESLCALLRGEEPKWRDEFFYEHRMDNKRIPKSEGVRGSRYVYARYYEQQPVHEELYDLRKDPRQAHNLAESAGHATTLQQMRSRCDALRTVYVRD